VAVETPGERSLDVGHSPPPPAWAGLAATSRKAAGGIAGDTATLALGFYVCQFCLVIAGFIQKRLLGPQATGYWTLIGTFWVFMSLASLGAVAGTIREVPNYRGRDDYEAAAEAADTGATFGVAAYALAGLIVIGVALAFGASWSPQLRWGVVLLGLLAPLRALVDVHYDLIRLVRRFDILAASLVLTGLLTLSVQTALVYALGYYGMFAGLALLCVASLATWWWFGFAGIRRPAFRPRLVRRRLRELVLAGIPITLYSNIWILFISVDTLLVASLLSVKQVGYYSLAVSVNSYLLFLPRIVSSAIFPRMQETYGESEDAAAVRHYAWDVPRVLAFVFVPLMIAAAFFLLPVLVRAVLPAFVPGIPAMRVMVAGAIFLALVDMPIEFLITVNARWLATALIVGCLALNAGLNLVALLGFDGGIRGAAIATASSYLVLWLVMTVVALRRVYTARLVAVQIATLLAVSAQLLGLLWLLERLVGTSDRGSVDLALGLAKVALALALMTPWFVYAERRYAVFGRTRRLAGAAILRLRRPRIASA
jgi:O-antigen/teichoic acid export membrane protein